MIFDFLKKQGLSKVSPASRPAFFVRLLGVLPYWFLALWQKNLAFSPPFMLFLLLGLILWGLVQKFRYEWPYFIRYQLLASLFSLFVLGFLMQGLVLLTQSIAFTLTLFPSVGEFAPFMMVFALWLGKCFLWLWVLYATFFCIRGVLPPMYWVESLVLRAL